jgi:hypothetical protein
MGAWIGRRYDFSLQISFDKRIRSILMPEAKMYVTTNIQSLTGQK